MQPRPSLQMLADRLGISRMTVSRALRGLPNVSTALRAKIEAVAHEMGYKADARISSVMRTIRQTARPDYRETVAFVRTHPTAYFGRQVKIGALQQAEHFGFKIEEFEAWEPGLKARGLSRVLEARGIRGVILSPNASRNHPHFWLDWPKFSVVLIGSSLANRDLPRVKWSHYQNCRIAVRRLLRHGYRRIGLVVDANLNERAHRAYPAAFAQFVELPPRERERLCFISKTPGDWIRWLERVQPEVLLSDSPRRLEELQTAGWRVPDDIGFASLALDEADTPIAGVWLNSQRVGEHAVNLLATHLQTNQRGRQPASPVIEVIGEWRTAPTLRQLRAHC